MLISNNEHKSYATVTYMYDKVKEDATTKGYGGTYSGEHADTVQNDGTAIVGSKPIYYYSTVGHNNVHFGNYCWQIVRTTDTGGIKLIYNGTYDNTNKCERTTTTKNVESSTTTTLTISSGQTYYYGTSYTFNETTGKFKLGGTTNTYDYSSTSKNEKYTCRNTSSATATCKTLYFIKSKATGTIWNVKKYTSETASVYTGTSIGTSAFNSECNLHSRLGYKYISGNNYNDKNSTIKTYIDNWYSNNMTSLESYLENPVFCNDRSGDQYISYALTSNSWCPDDCGDFIFRNYLMSKYYGDGRDDYSKLSCDNVKDRFSTNNTNAKLSHPIGLITAPEYKLLDSTTKNTNERWWTISPATYVYEYSSSVNIGTNRMIYVNESGNKSMQTTCKEYGVRPLVSLKPNIKFEDGTGSVSDPYIVRLSPIVTYKAGSGGTLSGTSTEDLEVGDSPTGRDITPNNGYTFIGWVANKNVTLSNNDTITKGTVMTKEQTQSIVISESITLTAKYYKGWLYDQIKTDTTTNSYGSTYTGEHADTVQNDGTAIVGSKPIYHYLTRGYGKVIFAGFCWQIIRTTDSGGVKLIYDGVPSSGKCTASGSDEQIGTSAFNSNHYNAKDVGLKYDNNGTNSTILSYLNTWYESNLTSYASYLEDTVFCNDRTGSTTESSAGTGTTYYDSGTSNFYYHNYDKSYSNLYCDNVKDRFSTNNNSAKLTHPIGLMSQPEYLLGGSTNSSNVHRTGEDYWLVSPYNFNDVANVRSVYDDSLHYDYVSYTHGVRPSVSLAPNITFEDGSGTTDDPYIVGDIINPEITATFYYQSSSTSGTQTIASKTETCTPSNGSCEVTIPSEVKNSVGKYNNSYAGLSTNIGTMSTSGGASKNDTTVTISDDTTFYATYSSSVTNYYYN